MTPRDAWQRLQSHLSAARAFLEAGDHDRALAEADAALAIDPQFLAAQSLRQRILSAAPLASSRRVPAPTTEPVLTVPVAVPAAAETIVDLPLRLPPPEPPRSPDNGYAKFEQRARRRRVDRRLDAARAAIAERRLPEATGALDEVRDLDPNAPELVELTAALESLRRGRTVPRRGAWLAAALVFGVTVFAASWLEENQRALFSHPLLSMAGLVEAPHQEALPHAVDEAQVNDATSGTSSSDSVSSEAPSDAPTPIAGTASSANVESAFAAPSSASGVLPAATSGRATTAAPGSPAAAPRPPATAPVSQAAALGPSAAAPVSAYAAVTATQPVVPPVPNAVAPAQLHAALPAATSPSAAAPFNAAPPAAAPSSTVASRAVDTPPVPVASQRPQVDETALVRQTLQRYRVAYDGLDAGSAQAVWPAVNQGALAKAFEGLESQKLTFDDCRVQLQNETATATCRGTTRYVPKVGSREPRTEPRVWNFSLRKNGSEWKIDNARVER